VHQRRQLPSCNVCRTRWLVWCCSNRDELTQSPFCGHFTGCLSNIGWLTSWPSQSASASSNFTALYFINYFTYLVTYLLKTLYLTHSFQPWKSPVTPFITLLHSIEFTPTHLPQQPHGHLPDWTLCLDFLLVTINFVISIWLSILLIPLPLSIPQTLPSVPVIVITHLNNVCTQLWCWHSLWSVTTHELNVYHELLQ